MIPANNKLLVNKENLPNVPVGPKPIDIKSIRNRKNLLEPKKKPQNVDLRAYSPMDQILFNLSMFPQFNLFSEVGSSKNIPFSHLTAIWRNLFEEEQSGRHRKQFYMGKQQEINDSMREMLTEWIVTIAKEFKLKEQTLFIAVEIIDRFSTAAQIRVKKYQLLGAAAVLIACKYNEVNFPPLKQISAITENAFSEEEVKHMEFLILQVLDFNLTLPTALDFYSMSAIKMNFSQEMEVTSQLLLRISLVKYDFVKYTNSTVGIGIAILIKKMFFPSEKTEFEKMHHLKALSDLSYCLTELFKTLREILSGKYGEIASLYGEDVFIRIEEFVDRQAIRV